MASTQNVETSVTANSHSQGSFHPQDQIASRYVTPGFKPFSLLSNQTVRCPSGAGFLLNEFIETIHEDNISSFDNLLRGLGVQRSCYNNQWAKIKIIINN